MRRVALLVLALLFASGAPHAAEGDLQHRQTEARRGQDALRERISRLEKQIAGTESSRRDVSVELKKSETAISELDRQLEILASDTQRTGEELEDVRRRIGEQSEELHRRQNHLGEQLRAQYAGGLSPWAALLSGEDPQDIARELGYLEYVARAQADAVREVRAALDELSALRAQAQAQEAELRRLAQETTQRRTELKGQQAERLAVLERIDKELKQQRGEVKNLARDEERLGKLVDALALAIEEEAAAARRREEEARRLAEARRLERERRLAEEKRQAEAARQAEEARRLTAARAESEAKAEEARKVAQARREAEAIRAEQAAAEGAQRDVPQEGVRITGRVEGLAPGTAARPAPESVPAREEAPAAAPEQAATAVASLTPAAPLDGLNKGLPYPVRGEVQGRFGMERPEGGTWRGIVLRAAQGARVAAVAPGRVVYAGWLGGFGNLLIIDHGAKYLSVYAYNQGLLRQVGEHVKAGEPVATVGATGGQVEPGLYFEIRHEGKPVNPLLWLGKP